MSNPYSFSMIRYILVQFEKNLIYKDMGDSLNRLYSNVLPKHSRLFKDPETMTELLEEEELIPLMKKIIIEEVILPWTDHATSNDDTHIEPLIMKASISVRVTGIEDCLLSRGALITALESARGMRFPILKILIDTSEFYLTTKEKVTYQDWSELTPDFDPDVLPDPPVLELQYARWSPPPDSRAPKPDSCWGLHHTGWSPPTSDESDDELGGPAASMVSSMIPQPFDGSVPLGSVEAATTEASAQTSDFAIAPIRPDESEYWLTMYQRVQAFKNQYGHTNIPRSAATQELADWFIEQQRRTMHILALLMGEAPIAAASSDESNEE